MSEARRVKISKIQLHKNESPFFQRHGRGAKLWVLIFFTQMWCQIIQPWEYRRLSSHRPSVVTRETRSYKENLKLLEKISSFTKPIKSHFRRNQNFSSLSTFIFHDIYLTIKLFHRRHTSENIQFVGYSVQFSSYSILCLWENSALDILYFEFVQKNKFLK